MNTWTAIILRLGETKYGSLPSRRRRGATRAGSEAKGVGEGFDGDVAIELGVGRSVDGSHSAFTEFSSKAVMGDGGLRRHWAALEFAALTLRATSSKKLRRTVTRVGVLLSLSAPTSASMCFPSGMTS